MEIDDWSADDWKDSKDEISFMQVRLKSCKVGQLIAQLLRENILENITLANHIFLCGIAYLLGGNTVTQKDMFENIDAEKDGRIFKNIEALIVEVGKLILKNIDEDGLKKASST